MTLDALRAMVVFAEHANLTKAAAALHISQPALHVKLQRLSDVIGIPLYVREGRQLHVTDSGIALASYARSLDRDLRGFLTELTSESRQPVVLAAGEGTHRYVTARAVKLLVERGVQLRLVTVDREGAVEAVRSGHADVSVTVLDTRPRGLIITELATYPQVAVFPLGHPLARSRSLQVRDLGECDLILPPPGRPLRLTIERALQRNKAIPRIVAEADSWAQMLHFCQLGIGVCIVNGCVSPPDDLITREITDLPAVTYSALHLPSHGDHPRVAPLIDALPGATP